MSLADDINSELRKIWKIWKDGLEPGKKPLYDEFLDRWPMQYPELAENRIVFVGLNPSFDDNRDKVCKLDDVNDLNSDKKIKEIKDAQRESLGRKPECPECKIYPYYAAFEDFVKELNKRLKPQFDWEALEIFSVRERNQSKVMKFLKSNSVWTDFAKDQWKVFYKALNQIMPVCVVVANAFASDLISNYESEADGLEPKFQIESSTDRGYGTITLNGRAVPLLLSGMISGQRQLDKYSRERLIWMTRKSIEENR